MNNKLIGVLIFLTGTATVFAATHASLEESKQTHISGAAGFVAGVNDKLNMEMEFIGLEANTLYVARMENLSCESLPARSSGMPNGMQVATFVESNQFGSYSSLIKGLPENSRNARSVALYHNTDLEGSVAKAFCVDLG